MLERDTVSPAIHFADPAEFAHRVGLDDLDDWQEDLLLSEAPRILLNITRQGGKSTMSGVLAVHKALTSPGSLVLILAPSERQAKETFSKAAALYRDDVPADSYRKLGMELRNGSRIEALPGTEKTVRGYSGVDLLILDEAARVEDALYYAVRPMLAVSGGRLILMSTPFGKRGVFFEEWENGSGWERYEVDAHRIPRIPADFLAEERATMPLSLFEQEYLCRFTETSDEIFTHDMVANAVDDAVVPLQLGDEW
jgi:hypothetical protein